tara:strand:- start:219 stop:647 length:429 start_codon:yes stop_codon:yes gene_type:complete
MSKRFKDFLSETSYNSVHNPSAAEGQAAGFADPNVIRKINALMGKLSESGPFETEEPFVRQVRSSLSKMGLTFDEAAPFMEDAGSVMMPLTLYGGRFGKLPETPHDEFVNDDGLSDVEGGLTLEFVYTKTPHNTMDIRAEIK